MKDSFPQAKNPLVLRYHRLMDAFAKSDDERDFYMDKVEGFIIYADLDKAVDELESLEKELVENASRYCLLPKMTFYEIKKFMEGFVHEKVYDIDTKEKLLDIISSKEARENFLEFIYDHLTELEKWQQYYVERSRIRIIEWLRQHNVQFVFEEDLDLAKNLLEKVKRNLFEAKASKDISQARDVLFAKAKTYYSNEALNPRPKRGRPPKQIVKVELEPQVSMDIYTQVPPACRPFLYLPDISSAASVTFSSKFETEEHLLASLRGSPRLLVDEKLEALSARLESLRHLSDRLASVDKLGAVGGAKEGERRFYQPPPIKPKLIDTKAVEVMADQKTAKLDLAVDAVLPKKRGRPRKESGPEEFATQKRRRFAIKKVTQIKSKKEKN
ncbi:MAG: UPF0158 family protein [Chlamydiales bacterium]|nr:UPF0158 family protein [Chlamydiales bacterium]